jgi:hypothetical protein
MASNFVTQSPCISPTSTSNDCLTPLLDRETDSPPQLFSTTSYHRPSPPRSHIPVERRKNRATPYDNKQSSWNELDFASDLDRRLSMNVSITLPANELGFDRSTTEDRLLGLDTPPRTRRPKYTCFPTASYDPRDTFIELYCSRDIARSPASSPELERPSTPRRETEPVLVASNRNYAYPNLPTLTCNQFFSTSKPLPFTPLRSRTPSYSSTSPTYSPIHTPPRTKTPSPSPSSILSMSSTSSTLVPTISTSSNRQDTPDLFPRRKISYTINDISPPTPLDLYPDARDSTAPFLDPRDHPPTPPTEPARLRDDITEADAFFQAPVHPRSITPSALTKGTAPKTLRKPSRPPLQLAPPPSPVGTPILSTPELSTPTERSFMDLDDSDDDTEHGLKKIKSFARMRAGSRSAAPTPVPTFSTINNNPPQTRQPHPHIRSQSTSGGALPIPSNTKALPKRRRAFSTVSSTRPRAIASPGTSVSPHKDQDRKKCFHRVWRVFCCSSGDVSA